MAKTIAPSEEFFVMIKEALQQEIEKQGEMFKKKALKELDEIIGKAIHSLAINVLRQYEIHMAHDRIVISVKKEAQ